MWDICPKFLTPVLVLHRNKTVKYIFSLCTKLWTAPSSSPAIFFACHGMRMLTWATAKAWWNKSTDPMVLGSPWICRSGSRPFRFVLIVLTFWRFFREFELVGMRERIDRSPVNGIFDALSMILAWYCLAASLWFLCTTSWASFPGSFCFSLSILITIWQAGTHLDTRYSTYFILVFVFFARCSVHPVCLLLTIGFSCFCNKSVLVKWAMDPLATIQWLYSISSLCFSLACYTVDFTNRIKAIDAMLDSTSTPSAECLETLAGRSAVRCCWLAGINNWCFWIVITMVKRTLEGGIYHELVENHLPICTVCAPFLGIGIALVFLFSRSQSQWKADCLLTCFCCLPATLLLSNWSLTVNSLRQQGRLPLIWLYSVSYSLRIVTFFESLISLQTIVQAGCNPGICAVPAAFFLYLSATSFVQCFKVPDETFAHFLRQVTFRDHQVADFGLLCFVLISHVVDRVRLAQAFQDLNDTHGDIEVTEIPSSHLRSQNSWVANEEFLAKESVDKTDFSALLKRFHGFHWTDLPLSRNKGPTSSWPKKSVWGMNIRDTVDLRKLKCMRDAFHDWCEVSEGTQFALLWLWCIFGTFWCTLYISQEFFFSFCQLRPKTSKLESTKNDWGYALVS